MYILYEGDVWIIVEVMIKIKKWKNINLKFNLV